MSVITTGAKSSQWPGGAFLKHPRKQIQSDWLFSNWATHLKCACSKRSLFKRAASVFSKWWRSFAPTPTGVTSFLKPIYLWYISVWEMLEAANLEDHPQEKVSAQCISRSHLSCILLFRREGSTMTLHFGKYGGSAHKPHDTRCPFTTTC